MSTFIDEPESTYQQPACMHHSVEEPSESELVDFYQMLNSAEHKPAILKTYSRQFIPQIVQNELLPLSHMYDPHALEMDYITLLATCEAAFDNIKVFKLIFYVFSVDNTRSSGEGGTNH